MKRWLKFPGVQIALSVAAYAAVGYRFGPGALVISSPLFAVVVRRPLVRMLGSAWLALREHIWLPEHGKHYVFHGVKVRIDEGHDLRRWVNLADVRKLVEIGISDQTLATRYPDQCRWDEVSGHMHLLAEALVDHLSQRMDGPALRLRTWLQRNVVLPSQRLRGLDPE